MTTNTFTLDDLPAEALPLARAMENGEMLGAARNIETIVEILGFVARDADGDAAAAVAEAATYYQRTRGAETAAVANALELLLADLPDNDVVSWLDSFDAQLTQLQEDWLAALTDTAMDVLADARIIMAYDYSSTVAHILQRKVEADPDVKILIPESRTLDGGMPYVTELAEVSADVTFLSDGAIAQLMKRADAVLEGVETLCEDGSFFNTIGSLTCAVCAQHYDVPYYAATSMLKIARGADPATFEAGSPRRFADTYGDVAGANTEYVENELVPAELVTGVITERGLLAPSEVAAAGADFFTDNTIGAQGTGAGRHRDAG